MATTLYSNYSTYMVLFVDWLRNALPSHMIDNMVNYNFFSGFMEENGLDQEDILFLRHLLRQDEYKHMASSDLVHLVELRCKQKSS